MLESLRGLGYTTSTALADIIDNSISAGATEIDVHFGWSGPDSWIRVLDNGSGMDDPELEVAMRLGAKDPRAARAKTDLGRFGMGLKTASFSQARRLTVASRRKDKQVVSLRWDLNRLTEGNGGGWPLFEGANEGSEARLEPLNAMPQGTVVLWELMDRIVTDGFTAQHMIDLSDEVEEHLAMTFHRLLEVNALVLRINDAHVIPWDPFLTGHPGKAKETPEYRLVGTSDVVVQAHVLPHRDLLKNAAEVDAAAGPAGWTSQQGFYIYRNRRLLVAGGWLGLGERGRVWTRDEAHRLARIRLDIPNSADAEWKINVLKSTASPPVKLRHQLKRIAAETRETARTVFAHRGRVVPSMNTRTGGMPDLWDTVKNRKGTSYRISREHDLVASLLDRAGPLRADILAALRMIEETVPVQRIWLDTAEDRETPATGFAAAAPEEMHAPLTALFRALVQHSHLTEEEARERLLRTHPFERYPALVAELTLKEL